MSRCPPEGCKGTAAKVVRHNERFGIPRDLLIFAEFLASHGVLPVQDLWACRGTPMPQSNMWALPAASCAACWQDFDSEAELESHIRNCHPGLSSGPFVVASRPKNIQTSRPLAPDTKSRSKPKFAAGSA